MATWVLVTIFIANLGKLGKSLILTANKKNLVALIIEVVKDPVLRIKEYGDHGQGGQKRSKRSKRSSRDVCDFCFTAGGTKTVFKYGG